MLRNEEIEVRADAPGAAPPASDAAPPVLPAASPLAPNETPAARGWRRYLDAGIAASVAGHLTLLGLVMFSLAAPVSEATPESIPVELVTEEATEPPPPPPEQIEAETEQTPAEAAPPPPEAKPPEPKTKPEEAMADRVEKGQAETAATPEPEPPRAATEPPPAAEPPPSPQEMAALEPGAPASDPSKPEGVTTTSDPSLLSGAVVDTLRQQVRRCWKPPEGWTNARDVTVTVQFGLGPDGRLVGEPLVVEFHASMLGKAAADGIVAALKQCGPYALPPSSSGPLAGVEMRFTP